MKVYRIASRIEIDKFLTNKSFDKIGSKFNETCINNNHHYQMDTYYMHFFDNKSDIFYFYNCLKRFICTYDIPDEILNEYSGIGKYFSKYRYQKEEYVLEYAIPSKYIKLEYLESIEALPIKYSYKEFLQNGDYNSEPIYSKSNDNLSKKIII